jgi:hypothetical protein
MLSCHRQVFRFILSAVYFDDEASVKRQLAVLTSCLMLDMVSSSRERMTKQEMDNVLRKESGLHSLSAQKGETSCCLQWRSVSAE